MGEVVLQCAVKTAWNAKPRRISLFFDSGSAYTFLRHSEAKRLGHLLKLSASRPFLGMGDGHFASTHLVDLWLLLADVWCRHPTYVISDGATDVPLLVGHDFMQRFDIKLNLKTRQAIINRESLLRAQRIRRLR